METREYEIMFDCEDAHWWYRGLRDLILPTVRDRTNGVGPTRILDAGCGTGANLAALGEAGNAPLGLEFADAAFPFLKRRGLSDVARGSIARLPFADAVFDVVLSTDVLCCLDDPSERSALCELARVLRPGGALVLNLPAFESLRSEHDEAVHTRRRYTLGELKGKLAAIGLRYRRATYRNTVLFPVAFVARRLRALRRRPGSPPRSDVARPPGLVNRLLETPLRLENAWIRAGGGFPFGLSIFCVATKD